MATSAGTAVIGVRGDFRPFDRQMSRLAVTSRTRFAKVGRGVGLGFVAGLGAAAVAGKKAFGEFQEAEKATKQTAAVLKSTGAVANVTAKQIENLANTISVKSGIDDEAVQSSENLLLTFTSVQNRIGKGNQIFDRATTAITDMAAAMAAGSGGAPDLKGATIQVGKALQDPIKGITALRRVGVNFDQEQSDRIARWVEEGKQVKAQKFILAELTKEFGGSAAAQATGTQKLQVAIDNLFESFGRTFGPALESAATSVANFISQMQTGTGAGGRFADKMREVGRVIGEAWDFASRQVGVALDSINRFIDEHQAEIESFRQAMENIGRAIAAVFTKFLVPVFRRALPGIIEGIQGLLREFQGMINIVTGILTGDWGRVWQGARQVVSGTVKQIGGIIRAITAPLREVLSKVPGLFRAPFRFAEKLVADVIAGMLRRFASLFDVASKLPLIGGKFKGIADSVRGLADRIDGVGEKLDSLDGKKVDVDVVLNLLSNPATPRLQDPATNFPRRNQRRAGGMVPAMLSPGEVGITPGGGQFRVPGARTAADTVPAVVPSGTAILTASGQRMAKRGMGLRDIIRKQLPHFRKGGVAQTPINIAALAAEKVGFRGQTLRNMLAIAGRESHWNPRAQNLNASTGDHSIGLWQINQLAHHGRFGTDSQLMNPLRNAKAAKTLFGEAGIQPWHSMAGATQFLGQAAAAVRATLGKGGSFTAVTPAAITHPILSTQLRPLIDDALLGGIEAGRERTGHAGRVDLLQSILEGIVPESTDRATREKVRGQLEATAGPRIVKFMTARASAIDAKHFPYSTPGNRAFGLGGPMDCSGGVSKVIGPNLLPAVEVSGFFKTWGQAGKGKHLTTYAKGTVGADGHVFLNLDGKDWGTSSQNPGGGAGWFDADPSYKAQFIARHPKGLRRGGLVGEGAAQKILKRLPKKFQNAKVLAEIKAGGVLPGKRSGGIVGPNFDFDKWLRNLRREGRKPSLSQLVGLLGADQLGSANADKATRVLARRVQGRSAGSLVRTQNRIRNQIRRMARHGFTGPERIRTRRLRGGLSLVQDELGRPIGRALGGSDRLQELIQRRQSTLSDRLTVMGVDPDSQQGLQAAQGEAKQDLFRLAARRNELQKALKRARKAKNPKAVAAVKQEISEVDDQILGLKASIINLDKSMQAAGSDNQEQIEAMQRIADLMQQANDLQKQHNDELVRNRALIQSQGPSLQAALTQAINGTLGGNVGLGRSFPSRPGTPGLARL